MDKEVKEIIERSQRTEQDPNQTTIEEAEEDFRDKHRD